MVPHLSGLVVCLPVSVCAGDGDVEAERRRAAHRLRSAVLAAHRRARDPELREPAQALLQ